MRRVAVLLALGSGVLGLFACGESGPDRPNVAYVTNGAASFWTVASAGALQAGRDFDVECEIVIPNGVPDQNQKVEGLLARGIDGIAISPIDGENQAEVVNEAAGQTHVITHDSDAPGTARRCYVGMGNYDAGRLCGELIKEAMPDGGSLIIFVGRLEQDNARGRRQGVIDELLDRPYNDQNYDPPGEELRNDKYTILDTRTDQFDRSRGKQNAEDALAAYPDLGAMVGLFAYNPPLCLEALTGAGKLGEVKVIAFDEAVETLQGILDGHVYGTVVQQPYEYGYQSVRILAGLARGDESVLPESGFLDLPAVAIRQDNCQEFWDDLNQKLAAGGD